MIFAVTCDYGVRRNSDNGLGGGFGELARRIPRGKSKSRRGDDGDDEGYVWESNIRDFVRDVGLTNDGVIMRTETVNAFASATFENLQHEMAQGRGEHLGSLAMLMESIQNHAEFFTMAEEND